MGGRCVMCVMCVCVYKCMCVCVPGERECVCVCACTGEEMGENREVAPPTLLSSLADEGDCVCPNGKEEIGEGVLCCCCKLDVVPFIGEEEEDGEEEVKEEEEVGAGGLEGESVKW